MVAFGYSDRRDYDVESSMFTLASYMFISPMFLASEWKLLDSVSSVRFGVEHTVHLSNEVSSILGT